MDIRRYHACDAFAIKSKNQPNGYKMDYLHYHKAYEIYILEQGQHGYLINDKFYNVFPQDVVLLKPNVLHKSHDVKSYKRTCIYFTEEFLKDYFTEKALELLLRCFEKDVISLDKETFFRIQKEMAKMKKYGESNDYHHISILLGNVLVLLSDNRAAIRKEPTFYSNEKFSLILKFITQNYKDINRLDDIAAHFYVSTPHLCRVFKKNTGMTISHYLNHVKVQHACDLLVHTKKNILDIALECGFNSSMYFCKTFKEQVGCTPSEFRNSTS